tara:strand:- start:247 stop:504 length:258 start_codon:yes stop_codon:yes gene_type:complete
MQQSQPESLDQSAYGEPPPPPDFRPPGTFGNPKQRRGRWWYVDKKKTKTGYKLFRFLSPKYLGGTAVTPSYYEKITKKSFWKLSL